MVMVFSTIILLFSMSISIDAMENKKIGSINLNHDLVDILRPASLKLTIALMIAKSGQHLTALQVPQELIELIEQIKLLLTCKDIFKKDKKILINLISDPEIDIDKFFHELVKKYLDWRVTGQSIKQKFLNSLLINGAYLNDQSLISLVLSLGADVDARTDRGTTALIFAVNQKHKDVVKMLVAVGADLNIKDEYKKTALMMAAKFGYKKIVKILLKSQVDINIQDDTGYTALMLASKHGKKEIVKVLLEYGADKDIKNRDGKTALNLVRKNSVAYKEIIAMFGKRPIICVNDCILI